MGDDDSGPNHATSDQPGSYDEGMFIALVPITDEFLAAQGGSGFKAADTKDAKFKQFA